MKPSLTLLVEDNPDDEFLTVRAFRKSNVSSELVVVRDGCEALEYLFGEGRYAERDSSNQPALILLDLKLPKLDGIEVLRRVRGEACTRFIPVVILTTSRENRDVLAGYHGGANSYICKPVNFEEFVRAVGEILSYWLVLNEPMPV
ncbi:MAG TPA: response regulator [Candidatus Sulfotelmatobacter sp.]|nr:response regulator [Candidatus Sulfotelmatobacter sp.]